MGCAIREQIGRAEPLAAKVPCRRRHATLEQLAAACRLVLGEQSRRLARAAGLPGNDGTDSAAAKSLQDLECTRVMGAIEGHGMPSLHCQSDQAVLLNDARSAVHGEAGLPFPCPAASCTSGGYCFAHLATNTVHAPLSEASFLLHMPDFYHELGHLLLHHVNQRVGCEPILDGMGGALGAVDGWYSQLTERMARESAPMPARDDVKWMWSRWKSIWLQEAFCDLFALFAVGPAYAYSNLHLVSKAYPDIYNPRPLSGQGHPSGEARMRLLDAGMRLIGHELEADRVREEWGAMAQSCGSPPPGYDYAFPSSLLQEIAAAVLPTFGRAGLRGYSGGGRASGGSGGDTVAGILNEAWRGFWRDGDCGFRAAEKVLISRLAAAARRGAAAR